MYHCLFISAAFCRIVCLHTLVGFVALLRDLCFVVLYVWFVFSDPILVFVDFLVFFSIIYLDHHGYAVLTMLVSFLRLSSFLIASMVLDQFQSWGVGYCLASSTCCRIRAFLFFVTLRSCYQFVSCLLNRKVLVCPCWGVYFA